MTVLIYCRSGAEIGMGHVVRCRHLADELRRCGKDVAILTGDGDPGWDYLVHTRAAALLADKRWTLEGGIRGLGADTLIVDTMETDNDLLRRMRPLVRKLVVVVGTGWSITRETKHLANLIIWQGVGHPSLSILMVPGARILSGPDYIILGPEYDGGCGGQKHGVAIYTGGGVPFSFGVGLARELSDMGGVLVAGPQHENVSAAALPRSFSLVRKPESLYRTLSKAEVFAGTMGMTAYEAMACGTPPVLVSRSDDHERTVRRLARRGLAVNAGMAADAEPRVVAGLVRWTADDLEWMGWNGREAIDGRGVERVAREILA